MWVRQIVRWPKDGPREVASERKYRAFSCHSHSSLVTRQMAREIIGRAPSRGLLDPPPSNCSGPDLMPPMPLIEISEIDVLALDEKGDL